jgi:putative ABC transport system permease protein
MRNNNSPVIRRLALKHLKANKLRNAFAMSAIILICILFTTVFTITKGIGDVAQTELIQEAGSDFHAAFENVGDTQIERLGKHPSIKEYSVATTYYHEGYGEKKYMKVDDVFWKHAVKSDKQASPFSDIEFVGADFEEKHPDFVSYNQLYIVFDNPYFLKLKMSRILKDTGVKADFFINNAYTSTLFEEPSSLLLFILPLTLIIACGYLLIYNVFYISAVNDVKTYGLLKTIGTTGKQLKKIIFIATNILYLAALPIGLLLGHLIGNLALTPLLLSLSGIDVTVKSGPFPFVFTAVFAYITLMISIIKPQKIVGSVSPVAAVRYTAPTVMSALSSLKYKAGKANIRNMAWRNLIRNKGRTVFSILSVTISIIIFAVLYNVFSNISFDAYTNRYFGGDFTVDYMLPANIYESNSRMTENLIKRAQAVDGVTSVNEIYLGLYNPVNEDMWGEKWGENVVDVYGLPDKLNDVLKESQKGIISGKFDLKKWKSGNYVIVSQPLYASAKAYKAGDMIDIGNPSGKQYEILLVTEKSIYFSSAIYGNKFKAYIPENEFTDNYLPDVKDAAICKLIIDTDSGLDASVKTELMKIFSQDSGFVVQARNEKLSSLQKTAFVMRTVGYSMTLILAFIGLLNFINTFLAGTFSRKIEYAMLQSVGMSGRQLKKMLLLEGGYCGGITISISFIFGSILSNMTAKIAAKNLDFFTIGVNYSWVLYTALILLCSLYILTISVYKIVSRKSLVERLKEIA